MLSLDKRIRIASDKTPRNHIFHVDEMNGKFDPDNKLYKFLQEALTRIPIENFPRALNELGYPIHAFHQDKNGLVKQSVYFNVVF